MPEPEPIELATLTLDLESITLGEMAAIEEQTGRDFTALLTQGSATRRLIALFLHESRRSDTPPSWRELANRRPLEGRSSTSQPAPDGPRKAAPG